MNIRDSVILITGGAIRLGRAHGHYLAKQGAHIAFTCLPGEPGEQTCAEIAALGVKSHCTPLDVRDLAAVRAWVADCESRFGSIDVLINNASPWLGKPMLELTEADWDLCVDVTVKAAFFCAQAVAPTMIRQGRGVIVNVADLSPFEVWPGYCHHAVAKAGVVQITRYIAAELGPAIRSVAVAPGPVLLPPDFTPAQTQEAIDHTLVKRLGTPEDVSRMIAFLIEHDYLSGHVYHVDGGQPFSH
ncbi:MAG: SDR family NAD(P)-dependent oxidoreductase [Caldilineaceae bacterium]